MASKMMSREQQGRGLGKVIKRGRERKSKKASILYSLFPFQLPSKISLLGHPCPHPGSCALPRFSSTSWQSTATVCPTPSALMPGGRWGGGVLLVGGAAPRPGGLALGPCDAGAVATPRPLPWRTPPSPRVSFLYPFAGEARGRSQWWREVEAGRGLQRETWLFHAFQPLPPFLSVVNKLEARIKTTLRKNQILVLTLPVTGWSWTNHVTNHCKRKRLYSTLGLLVVKIMLVFRG